MSTLTLAVVDRIRSPRAPVTVLIIRLPSTYGDLPSSGIRQKLIAKILRAELGLTGREVYCRGGRTLPAVHLVVVTYRKPPTYLGRREDLAGELAGLDAHDLQLRLHRARKARRS